MYGLSLHFISRPLKSSMPALSPKKWWWLLLLQLHPGAPFWMPRLQPKQSPPAVAVAGLQHLPLDDGGLELQLLIFLLHLLLARRADAEVEVEVGAPRHLDGRRLGPDRLMLWRLRCDSAGGVGAGLERDVGHGAGAGDGAVRDGVDAPAQQLPPDVRVPVVLDLVVRPPREPRGDERPPAGN
jgi:hypothetical protein